MTGELTERWYNDVVLIASLLGQKFCVVDELQQE
jgi:hypothetical protein